MRILKGLNLKQQFILNSWNQNDSNYQNIYVKINDN